MAQMYTLTLPELSEWTLCILVMEQSTADQKVRFEIRVLIPTDFMQKSLQNIDFMQAIIKHFVLVIN